jgi:hypothetical protein
MTDVLYDVREIKDRFDSTVVIGEMGGRNEEII